MFITSFFYRETVTIGSAPYHQLIVILNLWVTESGCVYVSVYEREFLDLLESKIYLFTTNNVTRILHLSLYEGGGSILTYRIYIIYVLCSLYFCLRFRNVFFYLLVCRLLLSFFICFSFVKIYKLQPRIFFFVFSFFFVLAICSSATTSSFPFALFLSFSLSLALVLSLSLSRFKKIYYVYLIRYLWVSVFFFTFHLCVCVCVENSSLTLSCVSWIKLYASGACGIFILFFVSVCRCFQLNILIVKSCTEFPVHRYQLHELVDSLPEM